MANVSAKYEVNIVRIPKRMNGLPNARVATSGVAAPFHPTTTTAKMRYATKIVAYAIRILFLRFFFSEPSSLSTSGSAEKPRRAKRIIPNGVKISDRLMVCKCAGFIFVLANIARPRMSAMIRSTPNSSPFSSALSPV